MTAYSVSDLLINRVVSANRLLNSPVGVNVNRKKRECWAVALKEKGKTVYTIDGESVTCDGLHPVILPKGRSYSWKCVEPGECIIIEFDAGAAGETIIPFELKDSSPILNAFSKIEKALSAKGPYCRAECNYYLYEIILFLLRSVKSEQTHPKKQAALKPATDYINERYFEGGITNEYLSALCKMSTVYFRKTFFSVYGTSPIKYLNNYRINKAKALLSSDYGSIEQVALSVGYNSIYHFSKMFRLYTGRSPTEYVKNLYSK